MIFSLFNSIWIRKAFKWFYCFIFELIICLFLIHLSVQRERNNLPDLITKDVTVGTFSQDAKYLPISTYHSRFQKKWTLEAVKQRALVIVFLHSYDYSSICLAFWCYAEFWPTSDYYPPSIGRFRVRCGDGVRIRQSCNHFNEGGGGGDLAGGENRHNT